MFLLAIERQSPSLDDLEKSLQNVNAMLQSSPPKPVSVITRPTLHAGCRIAHFTLSVRPSVWLVPSV